MGNLSLKNLKGKATVGPGETEINVVEYGAQPTGFDEYTPGTDMPIYLKGADSCEINSGNDGKQ